MRPPDSGTVAVLFTDIEGSTREARRLGSAWVEALAGHDRIVGAGIATEDGFVARHDGDGFFALFDSARSAVDAAVAAQRGLRAGSTLRARMGVHFGYVERSATGWVGLELHRARRVTDAGHGGQLLLTHAALTAVGSDLSVDPLGHHRLKDFPVPEPLYCVRVDGHGAAAFPPLRTLTARSTNLPAGAPALLGRDAELARTRAALAPGRLVTLTGRGGTGKTTLARVAAAAALEAFGGGVWWIGLAPASDVDAALRAVASAVDAGEPSIDGISRRLDGDALLVLDNAEHLPGLGRAVETLIERAPGLALLATSQRTLRVPGEIVIEVGPLGAEPALTLLERARSSAGITVALDDAGRDDLRNVVDQLDHLPLALELAGARLAVLSPAQLSERLAVSPETIEDTGARGDRRRSLQATLDWSLAQLPEDARRLFPGLGAFAGAAELAEIEAVAGMDAAEAVSALLDCSLLTRTETGDGRLRFDMPQALRRLAAQRLDASTDGPDWRLRHARRQLELMWPARCLHAGTVAEWLAAANAEPEALLALDRVDDSTLTTPLRTALAVRLVNTGRHDEARALLAGLPEIAGPAVSVAAFAIGMIAGHEGEHATAVAHLSRALAHLDAGDARLEASLRVLRGFWRLVEGDLDAALADTLAGVAASERVDEAAQTGTAMMLAQTRMVRGELDDAQRCVDHAATLAARSDAEAGWAVPSLTGDIAYARGDMAGAGRSFVRSLISADARGDLQQIAYDMSSLAGALGVAGHDEPAAQVLGLLDAHCAAVGADRAALLQINVALDEALAATERAGPDALAPVRDVPTGQFVATACRWALSALGDG